MKKRYYKSLQVKVFFLILFLLNVSYGQNRSPYKVASEPWPEELGNHRSQIEVHKKAKAVHLNFNWRRPDLNTDKRRFIIIHSSTGDTIENIQRLHVDRERCEIVFGPAQKGTYNFYYLPFKPDPKHGFYRFGYLHKEPAPSDQWIKENQLDDSDRIDKLPKAVCSLIESRKDFDSFFPMEVAATADETKQFISKIKDDYLIFGEDRTNPVKMKDQIPLKWIEETALNRFHGTALKNEYYAFQLAVYAARTDLEDVRLEFEDLISSDGSMIPAEMLTCFNTDGVDPYGKSFINKVGVARNQVQPLWIGVDISDSQEPGSYKGLIWVNTKNKPRQKVEIEIQVESKRIASRGDDEPWRHSRLRWLNSTIGLDQKPISPNKAIIERDDRIELTDKTIELSELGLPNTISVKGIQLLNQPIEVDIQQTELSDFKLKRSVNHGGVLTREYSASGYGLTVVNLVTIESDGYINFKFQLKANEPLSTEQIRLIFPFEKSTAEYMMGMGLPGTIVPEQHQAKWEGPQDSFWIGNPYGGAHIELRGTSYHGPLLNLYKPDPPASWYNNGLGGFGIEKTEKSVNAEVFVGKKTMAKGEELTLEWSMLITPVKELDTHSQFNDRYYHNGNAPRPSEEEIESGVKLINVHHANQYNPYINYPFIATEEMRSLVDDMHEKGLKVKIYYTIRELTSRVTEIWALRSLGNEILATGRGKGYPWLQEHFVTDYYPQWYDPLDGDKDASILTSTGDSRWYNYYLEGLAWLVKDMDIDGLYLDDVSYDRHILKRMRKVLNMSKEGCVLDLHSNTGFSKGPAIQYTEFFPYLDKLWFGESFKYDEMPPENWLVEVSGIPFGHMGDMLHAGGNPWRGMVYGMTVRYPWYTEGVTCDPREIWKVWDSFDIKTAKMIGYWDKDPIVDTGNDLVKATAYVKDDKVLISLASWEEKEVSVRLKIDLSDTNLEKDKAILYLPGIEQFQSEGSYELDESIRVPPGKGYLLILQNR